MTNTNVVKRPKESLFYSTVLYTLARESGWKSNVGVSLNPLYDTILKLSGFEVVNADGQDWAQDTEGNRFALRDSSPGKRDGLYRRLHFATYHQTVSHRPPDKACVAKPTEGAKRGRWALTELGLAKAKALRAQFEAIENGVALEPNETAKFFGEHYERYHERMVNHLNRKLPHSAALGKIEDHVGNFLMSKIKTNAFAEMLAQNRVPPPSVVANWCLRSAHSDLRNEARNPVTRCMHGALLKHEIEQNEAVNWTEKVVITSLSEGCGQTRTGENESYGDPVEALPQTLDEADPEKSVSDQMAMVRLMRKLKSILAEKLPPTQCVDWHYDLLVSKWVKGMTVKEIIEEQKLDPADTGKVNAAVSRIRGIMRTERENGGLALAD